MLFNFELIRLPAGQIDVTQRQKYIVWAQYNNNNNKEGFQKKKMRRNSNVKTVWLEKSEKGVKWNIYGRARRCCSRFWRRRRRPSKTDRAPNWKILFSKKKKKTMKKCFQFVADAIARARYFCFGFFFLLSFSFWFESHSLTYGNRYGCEWATQSYKNVRLFLIGELLYCLATRSRVAQTHTHTHMCRPADHRPGWHFIYTLRWASYYLQFEETNKKKITFPFRDW